MNSLLLQTFFRMSSNFHLSKLPSSCIILPNFFLHCFHSHERGHLRIVSDVKGNHYQQQWVAPRLDFALLFWLMNSHSLQLIVCIVSTSYEYQVARNWGEDVRLEHFQSCTSSKRFSSVEFSLIEMCLVELKSNNCTITSFIFIKQTNFPDAHKSEHIHLSVNFLFNDKDLCQWWYFHGGGGKRLGKAHRKRHRLVDIFKQKY